ncbi:serine/threonine protein kinase [Leptothermofonsia sp. ETS-13]|uniref:serine/threonine protein kinase n=1 Tax=Leptothermofonsia sp. ETS-13 TaxID=3035696 RepID=UPI003B9F0674
MYAPLASGTLLDNRYRVVGMAKRGNLGQTYLVRDQKQLNALCVLKEFIPNQQDPAVVDTLLQLFHQEASPLYELRHPQLPRPRAMLVQGNRLYWIREYVEGKSYNVILDSRKAQGQPFSEAEVIHLMMKVLPVLSYLHSKGIVHGNLTLDTLILRQQDQLPVLINYGLVRDLVVRLQLHPVKPETALGTWGYIPPEKISDGQVYPCSDLYSLGVVSIALLTGKSPEELYNQKTKSFEWESLVNINPKFARILRQMLETRPQKRFASANQVMQALEPLEASAPQMTELSSVPPPVVSSSAPPSVIPAAPPHPPRLPTEPVAAQVAVEEPSPAAPQAATPVSKKRPFKRRVGGPRASTALVVGLALLMGVIAWKALPFFRGDRKSAESPVPETAASPATQPAEPPAKQIPPVEGKSQKSSPNPAAQASGVSEQALRDRVQKLGVNPQYFNNLVDETFYIKYPQLKGQSPTSNGDARQKENWNAIASALTDRLESLNPETRKKLGTYTLDNYNQWLAALGESGKQNSPTLDALADGRFFKLFPEWKGRTLNPDTMGQVWYAIADEMLEAAKAKKAEKKN